MVEKKLFDEKIHITRQSASALVRNELKIIKRVSIGGIASSVLAFIAYGVEPLIGLAILMGFWFWMGLTFNKAKQYDDTLSLRYNDEQSNDQK